jgi:DNA-binding Lrp family transcriptional regulator
VATRVGPAVPKLRSREHGAAVPLTDGDRRLLNLLQSSFPLDEHPFAAIARKAGDGERVVTEAEVLERTQWLLDRRIIREITPIYDTPALGYSSMLVAARVDANHPQRAAAVINEHPGVSHNYLRNHDFNLWFTIATAPDSKLGLDGTLAKLKDLSGADSIRQLPTLTMFKINMNLEMEGGTDALAAAVETTDPMPREAIPIDDFDVDVIRATQGPMAVRSDAYAPAAEKLGIPVDQLLEHLGAMVERRLLRRVAGILFHRRAGFSANGMGVWRVPEDRIMELGPRMAAVRGVSHCYRRPTYPDWPYSVFTMAHGRSKEECDAVLDGVASVCGLDGDDRSTLYSSTEYKKVRLHYFTPDYAAWEARYS